MTKEETVKIELDLPINIYRALDYICNLEPREDLKEYIIRNMEADVRGMIMSDWAGHISQLNKELEAILEGEA